jgi:hypothetical protein
MLPIRYPHLFDRVYIRRAVNEGEINWRWDVKWRYSRTVISQKAGGNRRRGFYSRNGRNCGDRTGRVDSETRNRDRKGPLRLRQSGGNFISSLGSKLLMTMQ